MGSLRKWLGLQNSGVENAAWADQPISPLAEARAAPNVRPRVISLTSKTAMRIMRKRVEVSTLRLDLAIRHFQTADAFRADNQPRRLAS